MKPLALVSARAAIELDEDLRPLMVALMELGVDAEVVCWDDEAVEWSAFELVVIRSTWDYLRRMDEFHRWIDKVEAVSTLANPGPVVRWNLDKRYLLDLERAGCAVVPTRFLVPGDEVDLGPAVELVVKPAVSAGSNDTERYRPEQYDQACRHAVRLLDEGRVVMVQPYISSVDHAGETGLLFFGGEFSHAVRKGPILVPDAAVVGGLFAAEHISARIPSSAEMTLAHRVLATVPGGAAATAYARVDLLAGQHGPLVLELELAEPSVFLATDRDAARRFALVLARSLRGS